MMGGINLKAPRIIATIAMSLCTGAISWLGLFSAQAATSISGTHGVPLSRRFPKGLASEIKVHSKIPVALPRSFILDSPMATPGYGLALDYSASEKQYSMNIFERPKGSKTDGWSMATLVGLVESTTNLNLFDVSKWFTKRRNMGDSHKKIVLSGHVRAIEFSSLRNNTYNKRILWSDSKWHYVADGIDAYQAETGKMANTIAKFVSQH